MADRESLADRERRFRELSVYLDSFPRQRGAYITVVDDDEKWVFRVQEIKALLLSHTFEIPALRKALDEAHGDIETLQEQIASKIAYPENEMAVLKRALHYLQKHATLYYSSGADRVIIELRQLIAEAKCEQVEGETLSFEIPKWEYMTMYLSSRHPPIDDRLNELGADEWELVAVAKSVAYLKRPIQQEQL